MSALRVGVIGLGVGASHAAGYAAHPDCELVALCDLDEERLSAAADRFPGARPLTDAGELLGDPAIDLVSIASYDDAHFEQARRALEGGKHVFCEKPLCLRREQAEQLHALLAERPELRLSSNLPLRASPRFRAVRELVAEGAFGDLYYLEGDYDYGRPQKLTDGWRGDLDYYSVVLGGAVHIVDLLLWLTGERVVEVVAAAGNRIATAGSKFRFDDLVVATLRFERGALAKVTANFACAHPHYHDVKLFGTRASFLNGLGEGTLYRGEGERAEREAVTEEYPGVGKADLIPGFVEAIRSGGQPPVTAAEVFEALAVCFAIEQSREAGGPVQVRPFG